MNILELPDLVLETICTFCLDWVALRCCRRLVSITWRIEILKRLDLKEGRFDWRHKKLLHEISSCRVYGDKQYTPSIKDACWILASMYFDDNDFANAWYLFRDYFNSGGKPYIWLTRRVCVVGTSECIVDYEKTIRAVVYVHLDTCQHIRLAISTSVHEGLFPSIIDSDDNDAIAAAKNMKIYIPCDTSTIERYSIANFVCNSTRIDNLNEYSISTEDVFGATDIFENYIECQPFMILENIPPLRASSY